MKTVWKHRTGIVADLTPAEVKAKEDEGGGQGLEAELSWVVSLSARSSFSSSLWEVAVEGTEGGAQKCEAFVVLNRPSRRSLERVDVLGQGLGWNVLALGSVGGLWFSSFFRACEESLCGFVGKATQTVSSSR